MYLLCPLSLQWATVHLRLPHTTLRKVINALVVELCRTHQRLSALPISTAILDRLQRLHPEGAEPLVVGGDATIEKSQMYSEASRRQTFAQWPHMDYKYSFPKSNCVCNEILFRHILDFFYFYYVLGMLLLSSLGK